ncbi:hypothetical protein CKO40_21575 [Halochromatium glycolicum]|uniref:Uncharacterized protein n=1 Tax=Halochromatium glycolicum TaxID=85075 RepID=A0AAJ0UAD2_9GAMM|nr:hypothetical protein [Halochromatium glycolicum]
MVEASGAIRPSTPPPALRRAASGSQASRSSASVRAVRRADCDLILLVAQFNDYRRPAIIVVAISLLLMRASFGFMVILGLYASAGSSIH